MRDQESRQILAARFEANRQRLTAVAYRMLGSRAEAEDAVQEAWLRFSRADTGEVANLKAWLTTVTARICLDMLRSRALRGEEALAPEMVKEVADSAPSPERDAEIADTVGLAMLVVLERLGPAERVAFVLHDMFDLSFDEIAPIVGRSLDATRQLASRARRRVKGRGDLVDAADRQRRQDVAEAFLAAARNGDLKALLGVLDPDVVVRADAAAVALGGQPELRGAEAVAAFFKGRARAAQPALLDGEVGLIVARAGGIFLALRLAIDGDRIAGIEAVADPKTLGEIEIALG